MISIRSSHYTTNEERWQAVSQRDALADGAFFFGVATTGVYCRPGCRSRLPRRENVVFFADPQAAEQAGFRPCKRCAPQLALAPDHAAQVVQQACQFIESADHTPTLQEMADAVGLTRYHFHRLFKKATGITPKQYTLTVRETRARARMQAGATIAEAVYSAGFDSGSRFYATAKASLGMRPSEFRRGGAGQIIRYAIVPCSLGWVLIAATALGVCQIDLGDSPESLKTRLEAAFPSAVFSPGEGDFQDMVHQTLEMLDQPAKSHSLPLDIQGTAFQRRVWSALQNIPAGETTAYSQIAASIGSPKAGRAVAQACAANPLAVAIPCHRVCRKDGDLGGYRWGVERKRTLLERESPLTSS
ncbi:MAG: bifunctional DNA-binding transcriptional regulator/O6-methylguanine-DNA methyltransferase Ada [Chloroflexi bacterium]|nr:bifunctional DNA-binding transcriptional regulator/O6-methylguanine-DNA methyltransferase Ada [Chloroflexota bacterium]